MTQVSKRKPDFSGWATRYNVLCADGRTIEEGAFKHMDGKRVPLVWKHMDHEPTNVLGHVILSAKKEGVRADAYCNNTSNGKHVLDIVKHGDIDSFSIFANHLKQMASKVKHGIIREVSLVIAGANEGAKIDDVFFQHSEDDDSDEFGEVIIYSGEAFILHEDSEEKPKADTDKTVGEILKSLSDEQKNLIAAIVAQKLNGDKPSVMSHGAPEGKTVEQVFNEMTEEQRNAAYYFIGEMIGDADDAKHSDEEGKPNSMKKNTFENEDSAPSLSHSDIEAIFADAKQNGSLKQAFLKHAATYGIDQIELLFPEVSHNPNGATPYLIDRNKEWVKKFMAGTNHSPMSNIKTLFADITADEARAKGYIKGNEKFESIFGVLGRKTTAVTVYDKKSLDKDDQTDITDFDVVAYMKMVMRKSLDELIARAALISDGRPLLDRDKVKEDHIRPIWKDDPFYVIRRELPDGSTTLDLMDEVVLAKIDYLGSGNLTMFIAPAELAAMRIERNPDTNERLYKDIADIKAAMGVNDIVEVQPMNNVSREDAVDPTKILNLKAIILDLDDYTFGSNAGGKTMLFDDFDIDFNKLKFLLEARLSGALTMPKSAIVIEQVAPVVAQG